MSIFTSDIQDPQEKTWSYTTDVVQLAKSHKRQEVEQSTELLFGVELEFNHSSYSLKDLSPLLEMGIFKYDSSVDGEYVTLPYTYTDLVRKVTALSDTFDKLLSANKSLSKNSTVGMHVHLSRKGLSEEQLDILRLLFASKETAEVVSYLCGRFPNEYCKYEEYSKTRYVALNEANTNTVEIRAFLSPSSAEGVLRNLALVQGWLDFANIEGDEWTEKYPQFSPSQEEVNDWWANYKKPHYSWGVIDWNRHPQAELFLSFLTEAENEQRNNVTLQIHDHTERMVGSCTLIFEGQEWWYDYQSWEHGYDHWYNFFHEVGIWQYDEYYLNPPDPEEQWLYLLDD